MLSPFNKPPIPNNIDDFPFFDLDPQKKAEMAGIFSLFSDEKRDSANGNVAPDTIGVDTYFTQYFVNEEMGWDFDRIEEDFMKHCYGKLREFGQVQVYGQCEARHSSPKESHQRLIVGLMLNGAKSGDEYCRELIKYLFKTYYKKLYNQLKRFRQISFQEILALAKFEDGEPLDMGRLSIVLTMCGFFDIKLMEQCGVYYRLLNKKCEEEENEIEEEIGFREFADGLFEECQEQVDEWVGEEEKKKPRYNQQKRTYWQLDECVGGFLKQFEYPEDYIYRCLENYMGTKIQMTRTLAVLRTLYPKKTFTYEEVQKYTHLYSILAALRDVSDGLDQTSRQLLGVSDYYDSFDEETMFHPENIKISASAKPKESAAPLTNVAKIDDSSASKEDYMKEIDELRRRLNLKEMENRNLKAQYSAAQSARKEAESVLGKYEADREELIALREFAYRLENEAPEDAAISLEDMKRAIADRDYVIIGGHVNWINKLKAEFPKWTCILPGQHTAMNLDSLINKEQIFFFTDHISHTAYGKCIGIARDHGIPFSYLHGVNMEQVIRQIYEGGKG